MSKGRYWLLLASALAFLLGIMLFGISLGTVTIPLHETLTVLQEKILQRPATNPVYSGIIWQLRLPRVVLAVAAGAGLTLCGVVMQALLQNPLAEPFLLGIAAGGYLGATTFIVLGASLVGIASSIGITLMAFIGTLGATAAVMFLASYRSKMSTTKLILSGTIVQAVLMAVANFILMMGGDDASITRVTYWTLGSLASAHWNEVWLPMVLVIGALLFFLVHYRTLDLLLQGEEVASTLGVPIGYYRALFLVIVAILTGALVSVCGIISFVGLIIPHITRALVGPTHRKLLPLSVLLGSSFLVLVDLLARTLIPDSELPLGIFTSLVGAPVFAWLLIRKNYQFKE